MKNILLKGRYVSLAVVALLVACQSTRLLEAVSFFKQIKSQVTGKKLKDPSSASYVKKLEAAFRNATKAIYGVTNAKAANNVIKTLNTELVAAATKAQDQYSIDVKTLEKMKIEALLTQLNNVMKGLGSKFSFDLKSKSATSRMPYYDTAAALELWEQVNLLGGFMKNNGVPSQVKLTSISAFKNYFLAGLRLYDRGSEADKLLKIYQEMKDAAKAAGPGFSVELDPAPPSDGMSAE